MEPLTAKPNDKDSLLALHSYLTHLIEGAGPQDDEPNTDQLIEQALPALINLYKGDKTKLVLQQFQKTVHSVQKFDPEPLNPQDSPDVLSDVVRLFISEVQEINDNIRKINEEAIVVHSIKQAEKEIK